MTVVAGVVHMPQLVTDTVRLTEHADHRVVLVVDEELEHLLLAVDADEQVVDECCGLLSVPDEARAVMGIAGGESLRVGRRRTAPHRMGRHVDPVEQVRRCPLGAFETIVASPLGDEAAAETRWGEAVGYVGDRDAEAGSVELDPERRAGLVSG